MLTSRLGYFLPTTKIYSGITKEKAQCGNYHYHKPLFTVCTVDLQMKGFRAWRSMARAGGEGFFLSFIYVIVFPTVASRTCDLEAKQIKKKKKTTNMQVFKFSSFTVYCRKRGNFHKPRISKARWFSILLLCLHLLLVLIFFLLSLLFIPLFF